MQGMEMQERADAGGCFDDEGYERTKNIGDEDTDKSAGKTDERSFGNKDVAYIFLRAPIARRIPISRVRSTTELDVMTPIMTVDTTRDIAATAMSIADTRSRIPRMLTSSISDISK